MSSGCNSFGIPGLFFEFAHRVNNRGWFLSPCLKIPSLFFWWAFGLGSFPIQIWIFAAFKLILHGFQIKSKNGCWRKRLFLIERLGSMAKLGTFPLFELALVVCPESKRGSFLAHFFVWLLKLLLETRAAQVRDPVKIDAGFGAKNRLERILDF